MIVTSTPRDENNVTALLACLNTDTVQGTNFVPIGMMGDTILVDTVATKSFTMVPVDPRDQNYVGCWLFKGLDGNVYPAVATVDGHLLIDAI